MKALSQIGALLQMSLSGIRQRLGASAVTVIGITCVVAVLVSMLAMGAGGRQLTMQTARADRAVIRSQGATFAMTSNIDRSAVPILEDLPGIRKDADGKPLAAAVTLVTGEARKKVDNARISVPIFGVPMQYFKVFPELRLTQGRMFQPAVYEIIVGKSRHEMFKGLEIGDRIHLRGVDWTVVGHFDSGGGVNEGSFMADVDTVQSVYKRSSVQTITVMLDSPAALATLQAAAKANPTVSVDVLSELEVTRQFAKISTRFLDFISYFIGAVMAIGATLGAVNVMYTIVDSRRREMATLRAIGFGGMPIVVSVLVESLILAVPGAVLGLFFAWLLFNGHTMAPGGATFRMLITPQLAVFGVAWALVMGLLGGLLPAMRAARVPVATALRAT